MVRKQGQRHVIRIRGLPRIKWLPRLELPISHRLKSLRLRLRGGRSEASLAYAMRNQTLPSCTGAVGAELGAGKPMTLSSGAVHRHDWRGIRRLQRKVSRCKRGSKNRRKAVARLARIERSGQIRNLQEPRLWTLMDRDVNAAINVLAAGVLVAGASTSAARPCAPPEPYA